MTHICTRIKNNLYIYEDIHNEEEFGVIQISEKVFDRPDIAQFFNVEQYCFDYNKEMISYYRPVFYFVIKEEVNYRSVIKYFDIKKFLKYRYRIDTYSFDEYFDYKIFGKKCLEEFLWYEFNDYGLIIEEK